MDYPTEALLDLRSYLTSLSRNFLNIGVIGSRDGIRKDFVYYHMNHILDICLECGLTKSMIHIISGGARGVDTFGVEWGVDSNIAEPVIFLPDWERFGKRAGYIRNNDIVETSDIIIAFWDGKSKGTAHSIKLAIDKKKIVLVFKHTGSLETFNINNEEIRNMF